MPNIKNPLVYPDVLEACHAELRRHFEPMVKATLALAEVEVFTALTLRLVRLAKATRLLCDAGLGEESQLQIRAASEAVVNLLYIMEVGPAISSERKSRTALAEQFCAYGNLAYNKLLKERTDLARNAFMNHRGMSDADFDDFLREQVRLAEEAARVHGCTSKRWHPMSFLDMARKVRDNAPSFFKENDRDLAEKVLSSFVSENSATHGDALSLRSQYKQLGNAPLELIYKQETVSPSTVAMQGIWAWQCIGNYYNQLEHVNDCVKDNLIAAVRKQTA